MASLKLKTRRDGIVVGEIRYYARRGDKTQTRVTVPGELQARRYFEALERALAEGAPIPPAPDEHGHPQKPRGSREPEAPIILADFFNGPYKANHWRSLAANTRDKYKSCWNKHITHPVYGISERPVIEFAEDPYIVARLLSDMEEAGCKNSVRANTLALLGSIFTVAMGTRGVGLPRHPTRGVIEYPSTNPEQPAVPQPPTAVALVAARFGDDNLLSAEASALYLMTMNVCGLRPQEARALKLEDVHENTLSVVRAIGGDGKIKEIKNHKWHYPPIPTVLADILCDYGERHGRGYLWPSMHATDAHRDWSKRVFRPARDRAATEQRERWPTLAGATPYDLGRHSFVSLYLRAGCWEGWKRHQLASWIGDTIRTLEDRYAGLIAEYQGKPSEIDAEREFVEAWLSILGGGKQPQRRLRAVA